MAARKTAARKTATKKTAARKAAPKKAVARVKAAAKKATPKKTVARAKAVAKKTVARVKAVAKKAVKKAKSIARKVAPAPVAAASTRKLAINATAPSFRLKDQSGKLVSSSDFAGRKLLVYFYPKADTPGCTVQSCSVRDHRQDLKGLGVDVVGISPDAPKAQAKFDAKFRLGFPLLADEDHAVAEAFGAWGEKSMYGRKYMGIVRSSFLIDERGRIAGAWYGVKPEETVALARAAL